jgi:hypothetical protein
VCQINTLQGLYTCLFHMRGEFHPRVFHQQHTHVSFSRVHRTLLSRACVLPLSWTRSCGFNGLRLGTAQATARTCQVSICPVWEGKAKKQHEKGRKDGKARRYDATVACAVDGGAASRRRAICPFFFLFLLLPCPSSRDSAPTPRQAHQPYPVGWRPANAPEALGMAAVNMFPRPRPANARRHCRRRSDLGRMGGGRRRFDCVP